MDTKQLIDAGGSEWESGDQHRIYFNGIEKLYGLEIAAYNSGNIRSAKLNGSPISNSVARWHLDKIQGAKLWYDMPTQKWQWQRMTDDTAAKLIATIEEER